jgi:hypothetical protein
MPMRLMLGAFLLILMSLPSDARAQDAGKSVLDGKPFLYDGLMAPHRPAVYPLRRSPHRPARRNRTEPADQTKGPDQVITPTR